MVYRCAVPDCGIDIYTAKSMHNFPGRLNPADTKRYYDWILAVNNEKLFTWHRDQVCRRYKVCAKHFDDSQWIPAYQERKRLKQDAVPNQNLYKSPPGTKPLTLSYGENFPFDCNVKDYCQKPPKNIFNAVENNDDFAIPANVDQPILTVQYIDKYIIHQPPEPVVEPDHDMEMITAWLNHSAKFAAPPEPDPNLAPDHTIMLVRRKYERICGVCLLDLGNTIITGMENAVSDSDDTKAYQVLESISKFKYHENGPQYLCSNCFSYINMIANFQSVCNAAQAFCENLMKTEQVLSEHKYNLQPFGDAINVHVPMPTNNEKIETLNEKKSNDDIVATGDDIFNDEEAHNKADSSSDANSTPELFLCKYCGQTFEESNRLFRHELYHTKEKEFKCTRCGAAFWHASVLQRHQDYFKESFTCEHCSRIFCSERLFQHHMKKHVRRSWPCPKCDKEFPTRTTLDLHKREHVLRTKEQRESRYSCKYCDRKFRLKIPWITHVDVHENIPKYTCPTCGKMITNLMSFIVHKARHRAKGAYPCSYRECGKSFTTRNGLRKHLPTHSNERPLVCYYCGKTFRLMNCLKTHLKIHTRTNLHACPSCGKEFIERRAWRLHLRKIHGVLVNPNSVSDNTVKEETHDAALALDNIQVDYFNTIDMNEL